MKREDKADGIHDSTLPDALHQRNSGNKHSKHHKKSSHAHKKHVATAPWDNDTPPPRNPDATAAFASAIDYGHTHGTEEDNDHHDPSIRDSD